MMTGESLCTRPGDQDDHACMERLRAGEPSALDELIQRYWPKLVNYALGFVGEVDAAEDMVQETFVRVWKFRVRWNSTGTVQAYLFTITRNLCQQEKERRKVRTLWARRQKGESRQSPSPEAVFFAREVLDVVNDAIEQLPPRRREVFTLVCLHGLSYKEAAQAMGVAVPTVANQMSAALSSVRSAVERVSGQEI